MTSPQTVWELRAALRALRVPPPDVGFEAVLARRLEREALPRVGGLRPRARLLAVAAGLAAAMAAAAAVVPRLPPRTEPAVAPEPVGAVQEPARPAQRESEPRRDPPAPSLEPSVPAGRPPRPAPAAAVAPPPPIASPSITPPSITPAPERALLETPPSMQGPGAPPVPAGRAPVPVERVRPSVEPPSRPGSDQPVSPRIRAGREGDPLGSEHDAARRPGDRELRELRPREERAPVRRGHTRRDQRSPRPRARSAR